MAECGHWTMLFRDVLGNSALPGAAWLAELGTRYAFLDGLESVLAQGGELFLPGNVWHTHGAEILVRWLADTHGAAACPRIAPYHAALGAAADWHFTGLYVTAGCTKESVARARINLVSDDPQLRTQACTILCKFGDKSHVEKLNLLAMRDPKSRRPQCLCRRHQQTPSALTSGAPIAVSLACSGPIRRGPAAGRAAVGAIPKASASPRVSLQHSAGQNEVPTLHFEGIAACACRRPRSSSDCVRHRSDGPVSYLGPPAWFQSVGLDAGGLRVPICVLRATARGQLIAAALAMANHDIQTKEPADNHIKAAEHLEVAAKHHREAAKYHKEGNPKEAAHQAYIAHGNLLHALEYQEATTMAHSDTHSPRVLAR